MTTSQTMAATDAAPPARLPVVDAARGAALAAMFVYHFTWDLSFFNLIGVDVALDPGWRIFARAIAGSFLFIVGVSLVLATRHGLNRRAYLRRLGLVAGAAASITLATWIAFPASFIFFGILHHIALASVLALPFLRAPVAVVIAVAAVALVLPFAVQHAVFAHPALLWVGLAPRPPVTNDYVPLLPWFGAVLAGMAAARLALPRIAPLAAARWQPGGPAGRLLVWGGRHSLWVYLVHQPVFLGVVWLIALAAGPDLAAEGRKFAASCQQSCMTAGTSAGTCQTFCTCASDGLKQSGLWNAILSRPLSDVESARLGEITAMCRVQ